MVDLLFLINLLILLTISLNKAFFSPHFETNRAGGNMQQDLKPQDDGAIGAVMAQRLMITIRKLPQSRHG